MKLNPLPLLLALWLPGPLHAAEDPVDFNYDIQPIISAKCFHCHGPDEKSREAKLRLDVREEALRERDGVRAIVPGDLKASELILRILSTDKDEVMPPPKEQHALSAREIDLFQRWIAQGAEYKPHWAFVKPSLPAVPPGKNPIDSFIGARLARAGLHPSREADRPILLRRVSLDLTGLPPTPAELEAFVADPAPDAYQKVVKRLLGAPAFGERWAKMWLDLARYADSTGYGSDKFRMTIWPYRDWVIGAFNRNLPYDQFSVEQIAGDLLPNPTTDQLAATAFHRNTMTNVEGGTDDEEYRVAAVKDRVATTGQVWMGLTVGCAQCHTHKFDPITHKDYYSLFAVFNQSEDADREDEEPKMAMPTQEEAGKKAALSAELAALETRMAGASPQIEAELHEWEARMAAPVAWTLLKPFELSAAHSALKLENDGAISASGARLETGTETYTLKARPGLSGITAFKLEALSDASLPAKGPGRSASGNAVLSELSVSLEPSAAKPVMARFVRVELPGLRKMLALAEVQAFAGGLNVAQKGKATQSSTDFGGEAGRAIDGQTEGDYFKANSVTHTREENDPWWEVDLGAEMPLEQIALWNRTDGSTGARLANFKVLLLDSQRKTLWEQAAIPNPAPTAKLSVTGGRAVALQNPSADFSQAGYEIARAIDGDAKSGWAFTPQTGVSHTAAFRTGSPVDAGAASEDPALVLTLKQAHGDDHTLGRFRIWATTEARPVEILPVPIAATLALEPSERTEAQRAELLAFYLPRSREFAVLKKQVDAKKAELAAVKPVALPIMRERPAGQKRQSFILNKGNFQLHGDEVTGALPVAFLPQTAAAPDKTPVDRLGLAHWLVSRENPLTARVAVNRFWAQLFGTGIVESEEDFGTQGQLPSHPELLDWLAVTFMESGWDMKALLERLVTSATYRQASATTAEHLQKDPRNRLLAHAPRRRLDAEGVRDQALLLSGLLSQKIGGPSVYPPQPDGLWQVAFNGGQNGYPTSTGPDRYRRGIYTFWRRTMPNPSMTTFDAPSRETCVIRRVPTNTPLQAFVTMNDPSFVECAQALGRRMVREGGADTAARVRFGLQLCLGRPAQDAQAAALERLFAETLAAYQADPENALKLATLPLGPLPPGLSPAEAAAWTVVANVLLNLDGVLTKG